MDENKLKLWSEIKHFSHGEFASPDSKDSGLEMNPEFVKLLDALREKVGFPLIVNSGYRTMAHNLKVGGKEGSAHTSGNAVDFACSTSGDRFEIVYAALALGIKRIGIGETFVHLDLDFTKPQRVMWLYPKGARG